MSTTTLERFTDNMNLVRVGRLSLPVLVVFVWYLLSIPFPETIASPLATMVTLVSGLAGGWLLNATLISFYKLGVAFVIAVLVGIPIGLTLGMNQFLSDAYEPILLSTYSIPKVVLIPIFLLLFGIGDVYLITFAAFHGIFPIAIVVIGGIKEINETHLRVGQIMQLSRWQTFRQIIAPSMSLPLLIALRLGFNLTFLGLILGSLFQSSSGLGFQLMRALSIVDTQRIFAINVVIVAVAVAVNFGMYKFENRLSRRLETETAETVF